MCKIVIHELHYVGLALYNIEDTNSNAILYKCMEIKGINGAVLRSRKDYKNVAKH